MQTVRSLVTVQPRTHTLCGRILYEMASGMLVCETPCEAVCMGDKIIVKLNSLLTMPHLGHQIWKVITVQPSL